MIVCHRHRFIFIKTRKTAGTSIEIALSRYCGPEDVITPISPEDEALRISLGYRCAQNFAYPLSRYSRIDLLKLALRAKKIHAYNHMSAEQVRELVGEETWQAYFKFTVERNPWDKVVSRYYWQYQDPRCRPPLSEFVLKGRIHKVASFDQYAIDGRIAVDHVIRYEDLRQEMKALTQRLDLPSAPELPFAKAQTRRDRRPYQELYGDDERHMVAIMFAREIAAFGYAF